MEGWSTRGGGKALVQVSQVPHWCMQGGLVEHTTHIREEQPTTSACLMIQTISATNLEFMQGYSYVYGAEYETFTGAPLSAVHNRNVSCAVCYASTRVAVTMIPAKTRCPSTWTLEYSGYLMSAGKWSSHGRTMYECVDKNPDSVPGSGSYINGALFYHVEASCTGMLCPPYDSQKELTCAVCTK